MGSRTSSALRLRHIPAALLVAAILPGCGGGDDSASSQASGSTISGTVATGNALIKATVQLNCASGSGSAVTDTNGTYSATFTFSPPCVLTATSADKQVILHSLAAASGTANITPLTELLLNYVAGQLGTTSFQLQNGFAGNTTWQKTLADSSVLSNAQSAVLTLLQQNNGITLSSSANFLTTPFSANHTGADADLDTLSAAKVVSSSGQVSSTVQDQANAAGGGALVSGVTLPPGSWPLTAVNDAAVAGKEPTLPAAANVCATLSATLTKNAKNLLDASVDSDTTKSQPDQARIATALKGCTSGQAVKLVAGTSGQNAFLSGPLTLAAGVTLWIDSGVTLFASRSPADYQISGKNNCGEMAASDTGCNALITVTPNNSGVVGAGTIDGRGGAVLTSGAYANKLTWWDLGALTKTLSTNNNQNNPRLIQVNNGTNFVLYGITLQNAPKFHVVTSGTNGATIWGNKILTPSLEYSVAGYSCATANMPVTSGTANTTTASTCFTPDTTKNTDGIDPGQSQNVLIAFNHISTGDDGIAIKSHTSPASSNIQILHNRLYYTHGMSIGSETDSGLSNVTIKDMTVDGFDIGATSGFRLKTDDSRGGKVTGVTVDGLCTRRVQYPLLIDSYYGNAQGSSAKAYPNINGVTLRNVHNVDYGSAYVGSLARIGFRGYSTAGVTNPLQNIVLDNVVFDSQPSWGTAAGGFPAMNSYAQLTMGPGPVSFASMLTNNSTNAFTVTDSRSTTAASYNCSSAFVAFPASNSPT